jgi:hypothetical protein
VPHKAPATIVGDDSEDGEDQESQMRPSSNVRQPNSSCRKHHSQENNNRSSDDKGSNDRSDEDDRSDDANEEDVEDGVDDLQELDNEALVSTLAFEVTFFSLMMSGSHRHFPSVHVGLRSPTTTRKHPATMLFLMLKLNLQVLQNSIANPLKMKSQRKMRVLRLMMRIQISPLIVTTRSVHLLSLVPFLQCTIYDRLPSVNMCVVLR